MRFILFLFFLRTCFEGGIKFWMSHRCWLLGSCWLAFQLLLLDRRTMGMKYKQRRKISSFTPLIFLVNKLCMSHQAARVEKWAWCMPMSAGRPVIFYILVWQTGSQWKVVDEVPHLARVRMHERPSAFSRIDFFSFSCLCPVTPVPPQMTSDSYKQLINRYMQLYKHLFPWP